MSINRRRRVWFFLLTFALLLVGLRVSAPGLLLNHINHTLATRTGYHGTIADVDISLLSGGYVVKGLRLTRGDETRPLLEADAVVVGLGWDGLLDGTLVADVEMRRPTVSFVAGEDGVSAVDWREELAAFVPVPIDHFAVEEGELHYLELAANDAENPTVDVRIADLSVDARNLANTQGLPPGLVATVDVTGRPAELGQLRLHADVDPFAPTPTFQADAQLKGVPMSRLEKLVGAHSRFAVKVGTLELAVEATGAGGALAGTVRPLFKGLKVLDLRSLPGPAPTPTWEEMIGGAKGIVAPDASGRVALVVPLAAHLPGQGAESWAAVLTATRHALVDAVFAGVEHEANRLRQAPVASAPERVAKPRVARARGEDDAVVVAEAEEERPKRKLFARKQRLATADRRGR